MFCVLFSGLLALPAFGQDTGREAKFKEYRQKLAQELKLSPEKEKEFNELGDKFMQQRMDLYRQLNQDMVKLKESMTASPPDEAKVKQAVDAVTEVKDKLWSNYQDWWHGEMKLLNPTQQAQYLMTLEKWWKNIMTGHHGMGDGKQE